MSQEVFDYPGGLEPKTEPKLEYFEYCEPLTGAEAFNAVATQGRTLFEGSQPVFKKKNPFQDTMERKYRKRGGGFNILMDIEGDKYQASVLVEEANVLLRGLKKLLKQDKTAMAHITRSVE